MSASGTKRTLVISRLPSAFDPERTYQTNYVCWKARSPPLRVTVHRSIEQNDSIKRPLKKREGVLTKFCCRQRRCREFMRNTSHA